mmetsp:Transcript_12778/g.46740  ORF Transcript_12778/g.46740 Transcript_12778/m.46740 type:complete len:583 (+) Transcript_12778:128-1876(+)
MTSEARDEQSKLAEADCEESAACFVEDMRASQQIASMWRRRAQKKRERDRTQAAHTEHDEMPDKRDKSKRAQDKEGSAPPLHAHYQCKLHRPTNNPLANTKAEKRWRELMASGSGSDTSGRQEAAATAVRTAASPDVPKTEHSGEEMPRSTIWERLFKRNRQEREGPILVQQRGNSSENIVTATTTNLSTVFRGTRRFTSRRLQRSGRAGARAQHVFMKGAKIHNGPNVSWLNWFLSYAYGSRPFLLMVSITASFITCSLAYAGLLMLEPAGCGPDGDRTFWRMLLLAFTHLTGGEPVTPPDASASCLVLSAVAQFGALLMQVVLLAIVATRFLNPQSELVFTPVLILRRRNNKPTLLMRLGHPLGHLLYDLNVQGVYVNPTKTLEGESYNKLEPLQLKAPSSLLVPVNVAIPIDKKSPLHEAFTKYVPSEIPGVVIINVSAYDSVLCCPVFSTYSFVLKEDIEFDVLFADVLVRTPSQAIGEGGRVEVDMQYMFTTVHVTSDTSEATDTGSGERDKDDAKIRQHEECDELKEEPTHSQGNGKGAEQAEQSKHVQLQARSFARTDSIDGSTVSGRLHQSRLN